MVLLKVMLHFSLVLKQIQALLKRYRGYQPGSGGNLPSSPDKFDALASRQLGLVYFFLQYSFETQIGRTGY